MSFSFSLSARELGTRRISQIRNGMSWSKAGSGALAIITAAQRDQAHRRSYDRRQLGLSPVTQTTRTGTAGEHATPYSAPKEQTRTIHAAFAPFRIYSEIKTRTTPGEAKSKASQGIWFYCFYSDSFSNSFSKSDVQMHQVYSYPAFSVSMEMSGLCPAPALLLHVVRL